MQDDFEFASDGTLVRYHGHSDIVTVPLGCTRIGRRAFARCPLAQVILPSGVLEVDPEAFYGCESLARIEFAPDCPPRFAPSSLAGCLSLRRGCFPQNGALTCFRGLIVDKREGLLLSYLPSRTNLDLFLPATISHIGSKAFVAANNLKSLHVPSSVKSVDQDAFLGLGDILIHAPFEKKKDIETTLMNHWGSAPKGHYVFLPPKKPIKPVFLTDEKVRGLTRFLCKDNAFVVAIQTFVYWTGEDRYSRPILRYENEEIIPVMSLSKNAPFVYGDIIVKAVVGDVAYYEKDGKVCRLNHGPTYSRPLEGNEGKREALRLLTQKEIDALED